MTEMDKVRLIQGIVNEIIQLSVEDRKNKPINEQEKAIELLARALYDFTVLQQSPHVSHNEALKGTVAKVKIAYNTIERIKSTNIIMTRIPNES
ncbi:hypothetical protein [Metabacillus malikii]|uniref:Uncharacterized protein n=1 Tax=Metabacillus malikii TaxID=1504265 RepID=A0ABT9ZBW6_9BACI|nr:hypothetical protein [Metabacillus malikii]MDQ0229500.1 hypothetical protein [Metabacillus malikii]